jgi:ArsR family transcriptional regulator
LTSRQFELIAKALADPRRMALLETIAGERPCPCARLRDQFPVSKATISHHIKELVRAGLVVARKAGQYLQCEVRREVLRAYTAELMRRVGRAS